MKEHKELHLYPGEKRLLYVVDGKLDLQVEAWGGPEFPVPKGPHEPFGREPTKAGRFRIGWIGRYRTATWNWSKIRWGSRIKDHPSKSNDLLVEISPGHWQSMIQTLGVASHITRVDVKEMNKALYGEDKVPDTWKFNDFGPIAIRYYEDKNNNRKQDKNENLSGQMFHTTPDNEAGDPTLFESHGCIHLRPVDRATLFAHHALEIGTLVVIHNYGETAGVPKNAAVNP